MNLIRRCMAAFTLGLLHYAHQRRVGHKFFRPLRKHFWQLLGLGIAGCFCYQYFFVIGVFNTNAGSAALILSTAPFWTAVVGRLLRVEMLRPSEWLGLGATIAGAAVIIVGGSAVVEFSGETLFGNLVMMLASMCWGTYTTLSKPLTRTINPSGVALMALLLALPFLTVLGIAHFRYVDWHAVHGWLWLAIVGSGSLSTGVTIAIWNNVGQGRGTSSHRRLW